MPKILDPNIGYAISYRKKTGEYRFDILGRTYRNFNEAHQSFEMSLRCLPNWAEAICFWKIKLK